MSIQNWASGRVTRRWMASVSACLCLALGTGFGSAEVWAADTQGLVSKPLAAAGDRTDHLLQVLEARAASTSFADLDAFAEAARHQLDGEGLRKLHHTFTIYLNQGETERAEHWNAILAGNARKMGDDRFVQVAELNGYMMAYDIGVAGQSAKMRRMLEETDDWYVRVTAARYYASTRFDALHIGEGLKTLSAVQAQIPENDPDAAHAHAGVWEMMGIGLMDLHDMKGATEAFTRYELEYGHEDWPRPDFDSLYNLVTMAVQVGDIENAERYFAVHDRLSRRTDLQGLLAYNALTCARVANLSDDMPRVVRCLVDHERLLEDDPYLQLRTWPLKIIALSRLGRTDEAATLLSRWQSLNTAQPGSYLHNIGLRARAELLFATGQPDEAMRLMRVFVARELANEARAYGEGVHQVTKDMEVQLTQRRHQLAIEQANVRLQADVIRAQTWIVGVTLFFLVCGAIVVIWLWVQARELRLARSRAERASTAKTRFLANMSHEIRTPLNGVIAMADALGQRRLARKDLELVDIIRNSATTLERLLNDILDSARIESGELRLESAPFDLKAMLDSAVGLWAARAEEKGVALKLVCGEGIARTVMGDAVRLRQVLTNLVSNALKFTDTGSVTIEAVPSDGGRVYFCVTDTGCGFDESVRQRIFARFQQADESTTRRYGGSGLGLNISQELVALMGGQMDCASMPGHGAKFWFEIRLPEVDAPAVPLPPEPAPPPVDLVQDVSKGLGLRVLLADDHAANRKVVEVLLSSVDADIVSVADGEEAVRAFGGDHFNLVLMDMQMPVMDGLTATRRLREIERRDGRVHTPVVMLTANAMAEHVEASLAAGADAHLTKPLTGQSLMDTIASVLEKTA